MFKIKYDTLNQSFKNISNKERNKRMVMAIDIGQIMKVLFKITERKNLVVTNKDKGIIFVSILNIVAHYRHYMSSVLKMENSFILYCSTQEMYDNYSEIIKDLYDFSKYIPNFIVVPKIKSKNKYIYIHTLGYLINSTKSISDKERKETYVICMTGNKAVYQFGKITKNIYYMNCVSEKSIIKYEDIWTKQLLIDDNRFRDIKYAYKLDNLLFPYMIYHKKITDTDYPIEGKNALRYETRTNQIFEFINLNKSSMDITTDYGKFLGLENKDVENCKKIENEILFYKNASMKPIISNLAKSWNQKLYDKKLNNINEFYDLFSENNVIILWLNEYRG